MDMINSANTLVKKITYTNEAELQKEIDSNMVTNNIVYKVSQLMPISETQAYIVLTPDPDKIIVQFVDLSKEETEKIAWIENDGYTIMSFAEIEAIKKEDDIFIGVDPFSIEYIEFSMSCSGSYRMATIFIKDFIEAVEA